jgi:hypothetical protein
MILISGSVSANPVVVKTEEVVVQSLIMLFIFNLPINALMYATLLYFVLLYQSFKKPMLEEPDKVIDRAISVMIIVTLAGVLIDSMIIALVLEGFEYLGFETFMFIGMYLIFTSYYFSIRLIQKLDYRSSILIALGVSIFNSFAWTLFFYNGVYMFEFAIVIVPVAFAAFIIVFLAFCGWYKKEFIKTQRRIQYNALFRPHTNW